MLIETSGKPHRVFVRHPKIPVAAQTRVAAVVLHYRHLDDTIRCTSSLLAQGLARSHVYIVSNDTDALAYMHLCKVFPGCTVIQADDNNGYAGGNNLALALIAATSVDYTWIVNPDIIIPPNTLQRMIEIADVNDRVSIFGSKITFGDRPDVTWFGGGAISWDNGLETRHLHIGKPSSSVPNAPFDCDYVTGASLFFRSSLIGQVGFLPEKYFLYFEESHWCLSAGRLGHVITMFPETSLVHHKRSEERGAPTPTFLYYYCRNALLMCREFNPDSLAGTERQLRRTAATWLQRVAVARPQNVELSRFVVELGIRHGHEERTGRFDFVHAFERRSTEEVADVFELHRALRA